nr:unnamed protein product [Naegleria fowleri]
MQQQQVGSSSDQAGSASGNASSTQSTVISEDDLKKLKVVELKAKLKEMGHGKGISGKKKQELIDLILQFNNNNQGHQSTTNTNPFVSTLHTQQKSTRKSNKEKKKQEEQIYEDTRVVNGKIVLDVPACLRRSRDEFEKQ